ncbi:MAG: hypothetical protein ACYTF0_01015 [Planctomycetota bacterium]|jgi:hypothetical protein
MHELVVVIIAIAAALIVFGLHVVFGRYLIQALDLPTDLPDACRFEPPPPPAAGPAGASERAAAQHQRHQVAAGAKQAWDLALTIHQRSTDRALLTQAETLAEEACAQVRGDDNVAGLARCHAISAELTTMLATCPPPADDAAPPRGRLLILFAVLLLAVAWLIWGLPWLRSSTMP